MNDMLSVLQAIAEKYISIHVFDLTNESVETIKSHPLIVSWTKDIPDLQGKLYHIIEQNTTEESQPAHKAFLDLSTIAKRLENRNTVSLIYQGAVDGWSRGTFFRLGDENPVTKVVYAVENIDDTVSRENMLVEVAGVLSESFSSVYWISLEDGLSHNLRYDGVARGFLPNHETPTFESIGRKYMDLMVVPEDVPGLEPYFDLQYVAKELETKDQLQYTYRTIREEGIVYYRLKIVPFDQGKKFVLGFENVDKQFREQEELRAFESEQLTLLSGLSAEYQTVWLYDYEAHTARLILNNGQSATTTHTITKDTLGNYEKTVGQFIDSFVVEEERAELHRRMEMDYLMEHTELNKLTLVPFSVRGSDGQLHYFQICITKVLTEAEKVQFVCGFRNVDAIVAEEKRKQELLAEAVESAERANRAKSDFLFNMSHDIRTPMNAIVGYADLALRHETEPELVDESLGRISSASEQLLNLINDILDMSRIESGKVEVNIEEVSVLERAQNLKAIFASQIEEKNIEFLVDISGITHTKVRTDSKMVDRIMMNLVSNAVKFTPKNGTIKVCGVELPKVGDAGAMYRISVEDSGIGMSEAFLQRIFDPFEREKTSTVSRQQGTGLGMAIVHRLIELLHGSITVSSEQGKGSIFTVEIPMEFAKENRTKCSKDQEETAPSFEGRTVLLVEDMPVNLELAKFILEEEKFTVETAENGQIAVDLFRANPGRYDVILMDIQMPVMNGYEATQAIRALDVPRAKYVPILAMTANAFAEDKQKALEMGMNDHVAKPIDIRQLNRTLAKYLH